MDGWEVDLQIVTLPSAPSPSISMTALSPSISLIVSPSRRVPIRSHSLLASGALTAPADLALDAWAGLLQGNPAARETLVAQTGWIFPGMTTLCYTSGLKDKAFLAQNRMAFLFHVPAEGDLDSLQWAVRLQGKVRDRLESELLFLWQEDNARDTTRLLAFPSPLPDARRTWIVALVKIHTRGPSRGSIQPSVPHWGDDMSVSQEKRRAEIPIDLLAKVQAWNARAARGLLLSGDSEMIQSLKDAFDSIQRKGDEGNVATWALEKTALTLLCDRLALGEDTETWEGLLYVHVGELARALYILEVLLIQARDLEDFKERVLQENLSCLESRDLARRIRAHDWLAHKGWAPPKYNPLGTLEGESP